MPAERDPLADDGLSASSTSDVSHSEDDDLYEKYSAGARRQPPQAQAPGARAKEQRKRTTAAFQSLPRRELHEGFLGECVEVIVRDAVFGGTQRDSKVGDDILTGNSDVFFAGNAFF